MAIAQELDQLAGPRRKIGNLDPADVIAAAKNPSSALHANFEWDDTVAAHKHRMSQARYMLRSIKITYSVPKTFNYKLTFVDSNGEVTTPMFSNLNANGPPDKAEPYVKVIDVLEDPTERARMVEEANRSLERFRNGFIERYGMMSELQTIISKLKAL